jgi:murein DD-endopeptidase MepM/ murein hydrolase activator NlpD
MWPELRATSLALAMLVASPVPPAIEVASRSVQPGELQVLTIDAPADTRRVRVRAFGHDIEAFALGSDPVATDAGRARWRALIGIDLGVKPGTYPVVVEVGGARAARDLIVHAKGFPTRRLKVDPDFVTPPPSAAERIASDAELQARTWRSSAATRLWSEPFVRPVAEAANSAFGTRSIFNGLPRNAHSGADFLSPAGTPIHAPNAGRVLISRDLYFSGNTVVIDHGLGLFSMLAHLSAFDVREGDLVTAGQIIGRVGATGRVTGPHLHWAVRVNDARVDPLSLLELLGKRG